MQNMKLLIGVILGTLVLVLGVSFLFSSSGDEQPVVVDEQRLMGESPHVKGGVTEEEDLATQSAVVSGVTMVEFSDFQCPACKASEPIVRGLSDKYPQMKLVYRHFPLESIHQNAFAAAVASEAAANQEAFWLYHDILFDKQEEWSQESDPTEKFVEYADELGINVDQFSEDLGSKELEAKVRKDMADGLALGINSTPTFYVNGEKVNVRDLQLVVENKL